MESSAKTHSQTLIQADCFFRVSVSNKYTRAYAWTYILYREYSCSCVHRFDCRSGVRFSLDEAQLSQRSACRRERSVAELRLGSSCLCFAEISLFAIASLTAVYTSFCNRSAIDCTCIARLQLNQERNSYLNDFSDNKLTEVDVFNIFRLPSFIHMVTHILYYQSFCLFSPRKNHKSPTKWR